MASGADGGPHSPTPAGCGRTGHGACCGGGDRTRIRLSSQLCVLLCVLCQAWPCAHSTRGHRLRPQWRDGLWSAGGHSPALGHPVPAAVVAGSAHGHLLAAQCPWETDPEVLGVTELGFGLGNLWAAVKPWGPWPSLASPPPRTAGPACPPPRAWPAGGHSPASPVCLRAASPEGPACLGAACPRARGPEGSPWGSRSSAGPGCGDHRGPRDMRPCLGQPSMPAAPPCSNLGCERVPVVLEGVDGLRQPHVHVADDTLGAGRAPELVSDDHHGVWHRHGQRTVSVSACWAFM